MQWCSFGSADGDVQAGLVVNGTVRGVGRALIEIIGSPESLAAAQREAMSAPTVVVPLTDADLRATIPVPPSIRDFMAFEEHVVTSYQALGQQVHPDWYELPVFFYFTNPAAVHGPREDVRISPLTSAFDYELEVAAVIGLTGRDIRAADAEAHIAGYTILCDWSARDLQEREMRLGLGPAKGKDSRHQPGPAARDARRARTIARGQRDLEMTATVNDRPYSAGNFSTIYWPFATMIEYAFARHRVAHRRHIGSGTVGTGCILELSRVHGTEAYPWLAPGDVVELSIAHLGSIRSTIRESAPS